MALPHGCRKRTSAADDQLTGINHERPGLDAAVPLVIRTQEKSGFRAGSQTSLTRSFQSFTLKVILSLWWDYVSHVPKRLLNHENQFLPPRLCSAVVFLRLCAL